MKKCRDCGETLPLSQYYTNGIVGGVQKYRPVCKVCRRLEKKAEYYSDIEFSRKKQREKYLKYKDRYRAEQNKHYHKHKDDPKYREVRAASGKRYRKQNPEKVRAKSLRDARSRRFDRDPTSTRYAEILRCDPCCYCGSTVNPTVDHIIPIVQGGSNLWSNLTSACASCNCSKRDISVLFFLLRSNGKDNTN